MFKMPLSKGEGMNRKLKMIFGKTKKFQTIFKKFLHPRALTKCAVIVAACACSPFARAQSAMPVQTALTVESPQEMQARISKLEAEVAELKAMVNRMQPGASGVSASGVSAADAATPTSVAAPVQPARLPQPTPKQEAVHTALQPDDSKLLGFFRDTTINVSLDGYYAYNFNNPVG